MRYYGIVALVGVALAAGALWWLGGNARERTGHPMNGKIEKTDAEWRQQLTPEQYRVARQKGTERAFSGAYWNTTTAGVYECSSCGQPLFESQTKFDAGCGWPSFYQAVDQENISLHDDNSLLMHRTEVTCSRCGAHLGHVFDDGPRPTGQRFCMNSASLKLVPEGNKKDAETAKGEK